MSKEIESVHEIRVYINNILRVCIIKIEFPQYVMYCNSLMVLSPVFQGVWYRGRGHV